MNPSDTLALDEIVERVESYLMKSWIHAVVQSKPFRGRVVNLPCIKPSKF